MRSAIAFACALVLSAAAFAQPGGGPPPAAVVFDEARREIAEQYRPVTGELRAVRRATLAAEEEGLVIEIRPEEGDAIKKGEIIARLRDTRAKLDVARAEADLALKRATVQERAAELSRVEQDLKRIETLQSMSGAAWKELEDTKAAVAVASARLQAAEADVQAAVLALEWSKERLDRMVITAPFDGRVITKMTEVGQWLSTGDGVIEVLDTSMVDARLDVPERLIPRLTGMTEPVGIRIQVTGTELRAPIAAIMPEADPRSRLIAVRIRFENPAGLLRPGMSITGLLPSGTSEPSLTVPRDAIRRDDAGEYVFFNAGGTAAVARVRTLFPIGARIAIESSTLQPGMQVVVEGNERLFPGQPLMPTAAQPQPAAQAAQPPSKDAGAQPQGR